jgi:ribosomal protein S18 acetylase RimI-like enzyme
MNHTPEICLAEKCSSSDWQRVSLILKTVGMSYYDPSVHQKAFENSTATVFAYHESHLIGFGRAISDGTYQAAIYDVAVIPEFQKMGIGKALITAILEKVQGCTVILYAAPGKEDFYRTLGFRKMKTGMALFVQKDHMMNKGFTD